ncbi:unnamed protein product [Sphenostylis stenocarpa]|uniref:Uncharacterized protein n=1 Tax=Sphenostylis stenocarpa TaxID=92480 RepID=A0AA86VX16_9FABA|nr:unnamed protein product [Sphenostylis stenocarpa]
MKQNSTEVSNSKASTTTGKPKLMEHAELSLDAPICGASPFSISPKCVISFISEALSVVFVLFLQLVLAAHLLTVSQIATLPTSNWLWKIIEKSNGKGQGREANPRKTNNCPPASSSGSDKETRQSNKMVRGSKETNNPKKHDNYKGDRFNTSPNNPCETDNFTDHGYATYNCFNNNGDGEQNYSYCRVNSLASTNSYNNNKSGLQDLSHAEVYTSRTKNSFTNSSLRPQTFRGATIDNRDESNKLNARDNSSAIRDTYNNNGNGIQNFDGFRIWQGKVMDEHQTGN